MRAADRRPWVIALLATALAAAPAAQAASLLGLHALNVAPGRPWNWVAYGLVAPYVASLLWRRHARARFAAYVFFTHETVRGLHFGRRDAVLAAALAILLLQLPAARRWVPPIRPEAFRARLARLTGS